MITHNFSGRQFLATTGIATGTMSVLIGITARKSIKENRSVWIEELTDLKPSV